LSGQNRSQVPVLRLPTSPISCNASTVWPFSNAIECSVPARLMRHSSRLDSALTTDTPTPCRPPAKV